MTDFGRFMPEQIRRLAEPGQSKPLKQPPAGSKPILLNLNENPFGPSPLAIEALAEALRDAHRYPEIHGDDLRQQIASFHHVSPDQVLVTAGATEFLGMIARALLGPGLHAVTSAKSFIVYRLATQLTEGKLIEVPSRNKGYDLEAIAKSIEPHTRIVFIANPNNPTGSLLSAEDVDWLVAQLPEHVLLVLDEAYGDFAKDFVERRRRLGSGLSPVETSSADAGAGVEERLTGGEAGAHSIYSRGIHYVKEDRNVIILKTFSKAHGLAGLRIGYGIGPARLITLFTPLRTIFSVSSLAQIAAAAALNDRNHIEQVIENNAEQVEVVAKGLRELGFDPPQTWANFLYVAMPEPAATFAHRLRQHGIVVQPLDMWGAPMAIRVSIGTPEENQHFLHAMRAIRQ